MDNKVRCLRCDHAMTMLCESLDEDARPKEYSLIELGHVVANTEKSIAVNVAFCEKCGYTELKMQMA